MERIRYSSPSPERRSDTGFRSYREMSAHRCLASSGVNFTAGCGLKSEGVYTSPLFSLCTCNFAVTPAALVTLTKKRRVPSCSNSGFAGPTSTFTRLSALIVTIASAYWSSTRSNSVTAAASSGRPIAALIACESAARRGWPKKLRASWTCRTCCARGCKATLGVCSRFWLMASCAKTGTSNHKARGNLKGTRSRSEEHTSELQSPDTISYAVVCLKKKNNAVTRNIHAGCYEIKQGESNI